MSGGLRPAAEARGLAVVAASALWGVLLAGCVTTALRVEGGLLRSIT